LRIGLAYNQRPQLIGESHHPRPRQSADPSAVDRYVEWDEPETIAAVEDALGVFGEVIRLEAIGDFATRLHAARVDLLFNIAEGLSGPSREAQVPAIAEFLGVPYTASDPLTLALALHKGRTKEILLARGIATPSYALVETPERLGALDGLAYPAFLKPVWEGSSKGVGIASHVTGPAAARRRAAELLATYAQPVLAESYLPGDEFTVAILGNGDEAACFPIIRYRFDALPEGALPVMGYEAKWLWDTPGGPLGDVLECPARVEPALARRIERLALSAYRALGCRDWGRVDVRLDANGDPHILELNPLPGIIPDPGQHSCFPAAAAAAGLSYAELIQSVVRIAWKRLRGREIQVSTPAGAAA
jgi:D-alanine-D-alanine ligase